MYISLSAILVFTAYRFFPRKRDFLQTCEQIMNRMPPFHHGDLCELVIQNPEHGDSYFWEKSDGLMGMLLRLRTSFRCLQLVQAHRREGKISKADAGYVWRRIVRQALYSLLAFILRPSHARIEAARKALNCYCELVMRTYAVCYPDVGPTCLLKLYDLL